MGEHLLKLGQCNFSTKAKAQALLDGLRQLVVVDSQIRFVEHFTPFCVLSNIYEGVGPRFWIALLKKMPFSRRIQLPTFECVILIINSSLSSQSVFLSVHICSRHTPQSHSLVLYSTLPIYDVETEIVVSESAFDSEEQSSYYQYLYLVSYRFVVNSCLPMI